ncbi:serine/threonine protein kinase [Ornithinimicrobium sp. Arc0846-15]|nr:serine/threonine protein kinase [Ornithinimicrobium laminariae]
MDDHIPPGLQGYQVQERIGSGATATVWRGVRVSDGLSVAIKFVDAREAVDHIMREATVLSSVRSQHLIHLYDVIRASDERVAVVTQLAGGGSLGQVLQAREFMRLGEVVTLIVPVARALDALHSAGVAHGDVSPSNVLFLSDGMPVLADAGLASLAGARVTSEFGTDGVLAPEVLEGFAATPESDVYALGCLAWWALAGEPPGWVGTRKSLNELLPTLPGPARELIEWCLAPEPEDRPLAEEVAAVAATLGAARPIDIAPHAAAPLNLTRRIRGSAPMAEHHVSGPQPTPRRYVARHRSSRDRRPAKVVVGLVGVASAVALGLSRSTLTGGAEPSQADQPKPTPTAAQPAIPVSPAEPMVPRRNSDLRRAAQDLVDARADAWNELDLERLAAATTVGSPAFRADAAALRQAEASGLIYEGIGFTIAEVEALAAVTQPWVLPGQAKPKPIVLDLQVTIETTSYAVAPEAEMHTATTPEPASSDVIDLRLISGADDTWSLIQWEPVA